MDQGPRIIVEAPQPDGGRRVRAGREVLGVAYNLVDLAEFLRRAGAVDDVDQVDELLDRIEWHGGGPTVWT